MTPIEFIGMLRDLYPDRYADHSGGCYKFHKLLKAVFPQANGFYNSNHVITEIDGHFFDIGGTVEEIDGYLGFDVFGDEFIRVSFESLTSVPYE